MQMFDSQSLMSGREASYQNGESESERWGGERGEREVRGERGGRGREDAEPPPPPRNDRWKEPEPRQDDRAPSRSHGWGSDDVRRTRRDEVTRLLHTNLYNFTTTLPLIIIHLH